MADFPTSPSNGLQFLDDSGRSWEYQDGMWQGLGVVINEVTGLEHQIMQTSETAPEGAILGDHWYQPSLDAYYTYLFDGSELLWKHINTASALAPVVATEWQVGTSNTYNPGSDNPFVIFDPDTIAGTDFLRFAITATSTSSVTGENESTPGVLTIFTVGNLFLEGGGAADLAASSSFFTYHKDNIVTFYTDATYNTQVSQETGFVWAGGLNSSVIGSYQGPAGGVGNYNGGTPTITQTSYIPV